MPIPDDFERQYKVARRMAFAVFLANCIITLSIVGGIVFVGVHFLKKVW